MTDSEDVPWRCRIEPNLTGEVLIIARDEPDGATCVQVLIDGQDPDAHPAFFAAPADRAPLDPGGELHFPYVLPGDRIPFRTIQIRWAGPAGDPREELWSVDPTTRTARPADGAEPA